LSPRTLRTLAFSHPRRTPVAPIAPSLHQQTKQTAKATAAKKKKEAAASAAAATKAKTAKVRRASATSSKKDKKAALIYACKIFKGADKNGDGTLSKTEIRNYFKANPEYKAHIVGKDFTWKSFFENMDLDGDGQFDVDEFIKAVTKDYHADLRNEDGSVYEPSNETKNGFEEGFTYEATFSTGSIGMALQVYHCLGKKEISVHIQPGITGAQAIAAGVHAGDELLQVNGQAVATMTRAEVGKAFANVSKSPVRALFHRDAAHHTEAPAGQRDVALTKKPFGFTVKVSRVGHRGSRDTTEVRVGPCTANCEVVKKGVTEQDEITRINGVDVGRMSMRTIGMHLKNDTLPIIITVKPGPSQGETKDRGAEREC